MARRNQKSKSVDAMQIINPHAAGIDLGSTSHWVCVPDPDTGEQLVNEFHTDTPSLKELAAWLAKTSITTVAMESTGVYWIPLFEMLQARGFEVVLTDTRMLSRVPTRKTDIQDCQWIQQLHACGLLQGAFRPGDNIVKFRALARMQITLTDQRADWLRRMQKELDMMNIRVHRAVADITGATGMRIIGAIVQGERDPARLAELRDPRCKRSKEQIERELTGNWREEHLFSLSLALRTYQYLCEAIQEVEQKIIDLLASIAVTDNPAPALTNVTKAGTMTKRGEEPLRQALYSISGVDLTSIDGIGVGTAQTVLSEIGPDVTMFPTEKHFISYLRLAPNMAISGGKRVRGGAKKPLIGSNRIHEAFTMAALSAKNTYTALGAYYRDVAIRRGAAVAVFATARKLAQHVYRLLRFGQEYVDIGLAEYERRASDRRTRSLIKRASQLGYRLVPVEQIANS